MSKPDVTITHLIGRICRFLKIKTARFTAFGGEYGKQYIEKKEKREKLTQRELGELIGVSDNIIRNWENDKTQIPTDYIMPLCRVFRCSPTAFLNLDNKSFEWHKMNYKAVEGLTDFAISNPDLMEMVLYMVNAWSGNFEMLVLMAYYCCLNETERSHIAYSTGIMFKHKYNRLDRSPLQKVAYQRLGTYAVEWSELSRKGYLREI